MEMKIKMKIQVTILMAMNHRNNLPSLEKCSGCPQSNVFNLSAVPSPPARLPQ